MAEYGLRNTTAGVLTLRSVSIPAGATYVFFNSSTREVGDIDSLEKSMIEDSTGVNYMLAQASLEYSIDGVAQTTPAFYDYFGKNASSLKQSQSQTEIDSRSVIIRGAIEFAYDASPEPVVAGHTEYVSVPYAGEIEGWQIVVSPSGSATVEVWKTDNKIVPTVSNKISNTDIVITGTAGAGNVDTWTSTSFKPGSILAFHVSAATTVESIKVSLFTSRKSVVGTDIAADATAVRGMLFPNVQALLNANLAGVSTAFLAGGGCVKLQGSEWYGDFGSVADTSVLPNVTDIATGSVLRVGNDGLISSTYTVTGSPKMWSPLGGGYISVLQDHQNLFDPADQIEGQADLNNFVDNSGNLQNGAGAYFLSAPISVVPGELLIFSVAGPEVTSYGGWYNSSNVWIAPIVISEASNGCLLVPAGAAFIRVNAATPGAWGGGHQRSVVRVGGTSGLDIRSIKSIAAIGDSITNGGGYTDPNEIWWKIAGRRVGATVFRNYGVSGQNAYYHLTTTLPNVVASDVIFYMPGTADHILGSALGTIASSGDSTFYASLHATAEFMHRRFAGCRVIWCTPPRNTLVDTVNGDGKVLKDYADAVIAVARLNSIILCDFFYGAGVDFSRYPNNRYYMPVDGVHPNILGNKVLSELPYRLIR